ncbi:MAG: acyltransferase [Scytonema sp. PMC 1070.18]|nr:acyltransferase [Scytonema sp. PMC 1070.18]
MASTKQKLHLPFLDGMRGLAALYVVFSHVLPHQSDRLPGLIELPTKVFRYGPIGVVIFVVLSGYGLMLSVVRQKTGYLPGTLLNYFKRRARRILPPYYAAIVLCLLLAAAILGLETLTQFEWREMSYDWFSPKFSVLDVVLHLLLIHNFTPGTQAYNINLPLWSVALEWQFYFIFPLLLLPLLRRWGWLATIAIAFGIGLAPHYLMNGFMDVSRPWLLGSFALGMLAADIGFSDKPHMSRLRKSLPWGVLAMIFALISLITEWKALGLDGWVFESLAGVAATCLIIYCTNFFLEGKPLPQGLRVLESRGAIALGVFSYSLYLTHAPIVTLTYRFLLQLQVPAITYTFLLYIVSIMMSLVFGYLFYLAFEKRFTTPPKLKQNQSIDKAVKP